jgi:hypothetical protein
VTPEEQTAYLYELRDREQAGERTILEFGPFSVELLKGVVWYSTKTGPEPPTPSDAEMSELRRRENAGERMKQATGPYVAMLLILDIQRINRHRDYKGLGPIMFDAILTQLNSIFVDDPKAQEFIRHREKSLR